ncbi:MAG: DUF4350 domain-containing protein [Actinomycetota bacterium]|nr:DUF4350 domain-containing protein [Actinomycetota bacterium]
MRRLLGRLDARALVFMAAAVLLLVAYAVVVGLSKDYYLVSSPAGSTFDAEDEGTLVLLSYLRELGIEADTLQRFDSLPETGTIVVVASGKLEVEPTPGDGRRLARWVEDGGRLVLAGPHARDVLRGEPIGVRTGPRGDAAALVPLQPSAYARGVKKVSVGPDRILADDASWVTHMKDMSGQVLVSRVYGAGEVVWLSSEWPLANAGIGQRDNARLATLLVAQSGPVWFDEYHHGFVRGGGAWERLGGGGRAAVVLAALAVAVLLLAAAQRRGPVIAPVEGRPARTGAYIGALAELYRKAGARSSALLSLAEGLREVLAQRYGTVEAGRSRHPDAAAALERAAGAAGTEMTKEEFVAIARDLTRARREVEGRDG